MVLQVAAAVRPAADGNEVGPSGVDAEQEAYSNEESSDEGDEEDF